DAAWTMGLMTHTDVVEVADKSVLNVPTVAVDRFELKGASAAPGPGGSIVLDNGSINLAVLRYKLKDVPIRVAEQRFTVGRTVVPAGSLLVPSSAWKTLSPAVEALGLTAIAAPAKIASPTHELGLPRVALYSTWGSTQNVGWVRYAFDQYGTPYDLIYKEQVRAGGLGGKDDVIIIPTQGSSAKSIVFDVPARGKPMPYRKNATFS